MKFSLRGDTDDCRRVASIQFGENGRLIEAVADEKWWSPSGLQGHHIFEGKRLPSDQSSNTREASLFLPSTVMGARTVSPHSYTVIEIDRDHTDVARGVLEGNISVVIIRPCAA
jgi:hypothetical protein